MEMHNKLTQKVYPLRVGTFFEMKRVLLQYCMIFVYWWVQQYPVIQQVASQCDVSNLAAVNTHQWLSELCFNELR